MKARISLVRELRYHTAFRGKSLLAALNRNHLQLQSTATACALSLQLNIFHPHGAMH